MSEIYAQFSLEQRAAEAGRSVEYQRAYEQGARRAEARIAEILSNPAPAAGFGPAPAPMVPEQFRRLPGGDRGEWMRNTVAGMLRAVVSPDPPDEQAEEARRAREFQEQHEYVYGRRPSPVEARAAVSRRSDGVFLSGDSREIASAFKAAGLRFAVLDMTEPLPRDTNVTLQPARPG